MAQRGQIALLAAAPRRGMVRAAFARHLAGPAMTQLAAIFLTVFLAELGDKTQLATVLFATDKQLSPLAVFAAASAALVLATALAVLAGHFAERWLGQLPLKAIAGFGFIAIGLWTLWGHYAQA
jgi:putative Ca2+/H+ antiporter (TMEM165/GDT1 family)